MKPFSIEVLGRDQPNPVFWDREVVYFANLFSIFFGNEDKTEALARTSGPSSSFGVRFYPTLNLLFGKPGNLLFLEKEPPPVLSKYFSSELGLSLPEFDVVGKEQYHDFGALFPGSEPPQFIKQISAHLNRPSHGADYCLDGFVTDDTLEAIGESLGLPTLTTFRASRRANNKLLLLEYLKEKGVPTIPMELAASAGEISGCLASLRKQGFREAVVKSQTGASGTGLRKLSTDDSGGNSFPDYFFSEGPCLVQGWIEPGIDGIERVRNPSVQFFVDSERGIFFDITEQILAAETIHKGNQSPPPYLEDRSVLHQEITEKATIAIHWLKEEGYRGFGSFDLIVADFDNQKKAEVFISETNARVTAATYPSVLARHFFPGSRWLMRHMTLKKDVTIDSVLEGLRKSGDLFSPDGPGILPVNINDSLEEIDRKGQFLCVGNENDDFLSESLKDYCV